jgi:penicillin amidase
MQQDTISYLWRDLKPLLLATKPLDNASAQALQVLKNWNGGNGINSQGATVFAFWYRELTKMPLTWLPFATEWNEPLFIKQQLADNGRYCRDPSTQTCAPYLSHTLQQATQALQNTLGTNTSHWAWGNIHHAVFAELGLGVVKPIAWIWNRSIATPGGFFTVDVGTYTQANFIQIKGAGFREVVDLANLNKSLYLQSLGQSGNPFSPHYDDLMSLWREGRYLPMSTQACDWGKPEELVLKPDF